MSKKKFTGSINGKGYYIALILCAAAIGISGYLYYRSNQQPAAGQDTQVLGNQTGQDVQAVATQPGKTGEEKPGGQNGSGQTNPPQKPGKVVRPVEGQTLSGYAMDSLTYNPTTRDWRVHDGVDLAAEAGTEVAAAADGTVYTVYDDETMGMTVVIRHEGDYTTKYASLSQEVSVKAGDKVSAGQVIGTVGTTALLESGIGDHLHFSVSCGGALVDPKAFLS